MIRARRLLLLGLPLLLLACGARAPLPPVAAGPLREASAPVGSQVDVTEARLAGDWQVIEGAGLAPGTRLSFAPGTLTLAGRTLPLKMTAPGRFDLAGQQIWVHWLDADNRTAAMGDPQGGRVWIMDRSGQPGERLGAAREILDWYGYDLAWMTRG